MSLAPSLRTRLARLERIVALDAQHRASRPLADLSDEELAQRILRLELEREPTAEEVREYMAVPPLEDARRCRDRLNEIRRQLQEMK